jgi:hypothetical protein
MVSMKKIIIGLLFVAAGISASAQEFTSSTRDNIVKVKSAKTTGTGTVIGYEDDYVYILTSAQVAAGDGVVVTVKQNRYNAKKENSPLYSNINTIPFVQDRTMDIAVIKIHKAFLQSPDITAGNHGFGTMVMSTDTTGLSKKALGLTGFAGASEEATSANEKVTAHNVNKDTKYYEVESDAHAEGYSGALIGTQNTAVAMLLSNSNDAKGKAAKAETIVNYLKKNGVPHNLIRLAKLQ